MPTLLQKDVHGNWNTIPPVPTESLRHVNCHKFALYVIGRLSFDEMLSDTIMLEKIDPDFDFTYGKIARAISTKEFTLIESEGALHGLAEKECTQGEMYLGQILDSETHELAHSFIVERTKDGEFMCFDKQGFKNYPFSVHELRTLLDFVNKDGVRPYANQMWRFVPVANVS